MLSLGPEQWALVTGVDQNVFYDNGKGYVDLGLDNLFTLGKDGRLIAETQQCLRWLREDPAQAEAWDTVQASARRLFRDQLQKTALN